MTQLKSNKKVFCLSYSQTINSIKQLIVELYPGAEVEFKTIEEFRPQAWTSLKEIRAKRYDAIVIACYDNDVLRGLEKWQSYFLLTGAKEKLIIDLQGNRKKAGLLKFLL